MPAMSSHGLIRRVARRGNQARSTIVPPPVGRIGSALIVPGTSDEKGAAPRGESRKQVERVTDAEEDLTSRNVSVQIYRSWSIARRHPSTSSGSRIGRETEMTSAFSRPEPV